ncbi:MAG: tryptophan-rich sensory protein [Nannocystaceae bacterium]|nr:tryptophan-rich sensory protein [bacterium]
MLRWLTILATIVMITVNGLANALPINGKTTGDISDGFDILFTPAGYVFSIWGLIYALLVTFSVVQALPSRAEDPDFAAVRPWYVANALLNATWIFAWHHERFGLSLLLMLGLLGTLVAIASKVGHIGPRDGLSFVALRAPFSLYLGWISIATIANVTVVLWTLGLTEPLSDPGLTLGIVAVAAVFGSSIAVRRCDPVYAAVFVWALVGIAADNTGASVLYIGSLVAAGLCGLAVGVAATRSARRTRG